MSSLSSFSPSALAFLAAQARPTTVQEQVGPGNYDDVLKRLMAGEARFSRPPRPGPAMPPAAADPKESLLSDWTPPAGADLSAPPAKPAAAPAPAWGTPADRQAEERLKGYEADPPRLPATPAPENPGGFLEQMFGPRGAGAAAAPYLPGWGKPAADAPAPAPTPSAPGSPAKNPLAAGYQDGGKSPTEKSRDVMSKVPPDEGGGTSPTGSAGMAPTHALTIYNGAQSPVQAQYEMRDGSSPLTKLSGFGWTATPTDQNAGFSQGQIGDALRQAQANGPGGGGGLGVNTDLNGLMNFLSPASNYGLSPSVGDRQSAMNALLGQQGVGLQKMAEDRLRATQMGQLGLENRKFDYESGAPKLNADLAKGYVFQGGDPTQLSQLLESVQKAMPQASPGRAASPAGTPAASSVPSGLRPELESLFNSLTVPQDPKQVFGPRRPKSVGSDAQGRPMNVGEMIQAIQNGGVDPAVVDQQFPQLWGKVSGLYTPEETDKYLHPDKIRGWGDLVGPALRYIPNPLTPTAWAKKLGEEAMGVGADDAARRKFVLDRINRK